MADIYTIGHSNHPLETFLHLLQDHAIDVVVDVRSAPYSRYIPAYNKRELEPVLKNLGFKYLFMGNSIGGKPDNPEFLNASGKVDYRKIAESIQFQKGIDRLLQGIQDGWHIVLLCAEEDPENCHRHLLIAQELEFKRLVSVSHIRADSSFLRASNLFKKGPVQMSLF